MNFTLVKPMYESLWKMAAVVLTLLTAPFGLYAECKKEQISELISNIFTDYAEEWRTKDFNAPSAIDFVKSKKLWSADLLKKVDAMSAWQKKTGDSCVDVDPLFDAQDFPDDFKLKVTTSERQGKQVGSVFVLGANSFNVGPVEM